MLLFMLASCTEEMIFLVAFKVLPWRKDVCGTEGAECLVSVSLTALALFCDWEALHLCSLLFSPP